MSDPNNLAPVSSWSSIGVESISISNGHSALLGADGRALLTPDGFVLAIVDCSLVFVPLTDGKRPLSNIPISSLPRTPSIDGSELVPVVQGETTKTTTVAAM